MESASPFFSDQPRDAFGAILQDQAGTLPSGEAILSSEPDVDQRSHSRVASARQETPTTVQVSNSLGNPSRGETLRVLRQTILLRSGAFGEKTRHHRGAFLLFLADLLILYFALTIA